MFESKKQILEQYKVLINAIVEIRDNSEENSLINKIAIEAIRKVFLIEIREIRERDKNFPKSLISKKDKDDYEDLINVLETSINELIEMVKGTSKLIEIPESVTDVVKYFEEGSKILTRHGNQSDINWINDLIKRVDSIVQKAINYNVN
nr:hypothetical protein [uncultured Pedobacter sp.]